jgi:hypothetical protein
VEESLVDYGHAQAVGTVVFIEETSLEERNAESFEERWTDRVEGHGKIPRIAGDRRTVLDNEPGGVGKRRQEER